MTDRVVLAYSGGLDTSVAIRWLGEHTGAQVVALAVDVGQGDDPGALRDRALAAGAEDALVVDAREEFARDFCLPALKANALYEGRYPLVSALSRPLIARHLVRVARERGASAVAHGCTGKGNDQVRFEVSIRALAPELDVLAPARTWGLSREDAIDYARRHGIPVQATKRSPYSIDQNLWGRAVECGVLEDPWEAPPEEVFELTRPTATKPVEVVVGFEQGAPTTLDGGPIGLVDLVAEVARLAGACGFGRVDMVENRRVGIKSREVYECPGALALLLAHADLEALTLERDLAHEKARVDQRFAELVYDGLWFAPLARALSAFVEETQRSVTGEVRLRFEPGGRVLVVGRRSPLALYDLGLATYGAADAFDQSLSAGFVRLFGLGVETWARRQGAPGAEAALGPGEAAPGPGVGSPLADRRPCRSGRTAWVPRRRPSCSRSPRAFASTGVWRPTTWRARARTCEDSSGPACSTRERRGSSSRRSTRWRRSSPRGASRRSRATRTCTPRSSGG
jgi:argininosuccinate synthase